MNILINLFLAFLFASHATTTPSAATTSVAVTTSSASTTATYYEVTQVVDGDTLKINVDGKVETVRLIGIDTPETVDPRKTVQCFGKEASDKAKEMLTGKKVRIETDASQGTLDKYGRSLAYIFLEDGTFFNEYMIQQGYAYEYTYDRPYKYQAQFKADQKTAEAGERGLWSPSSCNGVASPVSAKPTTPTSASTSVTPAVTTPTSAPTPIFVPIPAKAITTTSSDTSEPEVKKSTSDICHERGDKYYDRTIHYTSYDSMDACVASGGRPSK